MLTLTQICRENSGLEVKEHRNVTTPLEATALILYYFESKEECAKFSTNPNNQRGLDFSTWALHNGGRSIGPIAGVFEYKKELAWAGFDEIMKSIQDPSDLSVLEMSYLLAVANPLDEGRGTPAMAKAFLAFAEHLMDGGSLPTIDPVTIDMRFMDTGAQFVQTACSWLSQYMRDDNAPKDEELRARTVRLAQKFLEYCPLDESAALSILNQDAQDQEVRAAAPNIQAAWLNSAMRSASFAFEEGKPRADWRSVFQKMGNPTNSEAFIRACLQDGEDWKNRMLPRIRPGGGLVPPVIYSPNAT